ncbi:uncharacterized protein LOC114281515 isoform X3 [Camellia sinensis]|uniref:uncharacterized protein LOC114281515 isoform X3 n=1 Tax=Camellia sinensis TaxID=4442 RepID=UPI001036411F|nr:uncharacterized protein LOC114281515 isoform X3 [Camellia sinensis]
MFAMERWCSLSRSISGGRGHKSLGRVGMAMGDPMGSNPNIYGFFSLFFTTGLMKWVFKISIEYGSGMGTRPFPHMLGFSFSISLSHSSEGNNLHRFCKGNDLAAAISVGVTTVVLQRELLALFCNWRNLSKRLTHQSAENTYPDVRFIDIEDAFQRILPEAVPAYYLFWGGVLFLQLYKGISHD